MGRAAIPASFDHQPRVVKCTLGSGLSVPEVETFSGKELAGFLLRLLLGLLVLLALVGTLSHYYREPLQGLGRGFVEHLGYWGMALGTLLADGFHFPVPPQFYMLITISSGASAPRALAAISLASVCGGYLGYRLAGRLSHVGWLARRMRRPALWGLRHLKRW